MKTAVVGSGAWGTALAIRLCKNGHDVTRWTFEKELVPQMEQERINIRLPGAVLPEELKISTEYACVEDCELVVIATPSFPIRGVCRGIAPYLAENAVLVSVAKGIESGSMLRMSEVVEQEAKRPVVVLCGPSHAEEVALDIPTGLLAAHSDKTLAELVQSAFMSDTLRIYTAPDAVGAELGGALKNVIALCAGVTDGLGFGDNTKAMLMTRGLTEMARLGVAMGASKDTFAGLTGVGDLIVTCTSMHSRNRRAGILIGQGKSVEEAMKEVGAVVEGYYAAESAYALSRKMGVDMPITQNCYRICYEGMPAREALTALLSRAKTQEEDVLWLSE